MDNTTLYRKKKIPIKRIVIYIYVIIVVVVLSIIAYSLFSGLSKTANKEAQRASYELNASIYNEIYNYIDFSEHINHVYGDLVSNNLINFSDKDTRETLIMSFMNNHSLNISVFAYINENNQFYGGIRRDSDTLEIYTLDQTTNWQFSVQNVNDENKDIIIGSDLIDFKTENWYELAKQTNENIILPVYYNEHISMHTIRSVFPINDDNNVFQGVIYLEINLDNMQQIIESLIEDDNYSAYIIDKNTNTVVISTNELYPLGYNINETDDFLEYQQYFDTSDKSFSKGGFIQGSYHTLEEYKNDDINWVIMTSVPNRLFLEGFSDNVSIFSLLTVVVVAISFLLLHIISDKLVRPLNNLVKAAEEISAGKLDIDIPITRNDEIGILSIAFNKMASRISSLFENLENKVEERTNSLNEAKEKLQIILDSTAEAIYGVDLDGICTFCNKSCLKILGYTNEDQLLGKRIHNMLFNPDDEKHSNCRVVDEMKKGLVINEEDEEYLKADGTKIFVEYHSYPQYKDSEVIGAVVTFLDVTEKRKSTEKIRYLSYHDVLTGLPNRRSYEEFIKKTDKHKNIPYSVIFADINGLKMTNDIFGHSIGDDLIIKASEIIKKCAGKNNFVARIGGDEFIVLLPKTDYEKASEITAKIKDMISETKIVAIMCSISLGCDTKYDDKTNLEQVVNSAENKMYRQKVMNRKTVNSNIINTIVSTLHERSPRELTHSNNVSSLAAKIAKAMNLSETEVRKIEMAGYLHDIGKIVLNNDILKKDIYSDEEREEFHLHPVHGYRILNLFDDTLDIAEGVYSHHEKWNGKGYPKGLKGSEIPLIARIIAVAEAYDALINSKTVKPISKKQALDNIKSMAGVMLDPNIVNLFVDIMSDNV
ncbi:MAG: diguanylate cyclase [Clostridia bacterium]|nr:diguanylate cyclase [Clostridia bacterium]